MSELKENPPDTTETAAASASAALPQDDAVGSTTGPTADVAPAARLTLGQTLRAAREAAQLSVEDVAHSLKFSPRQVELLEADNYAALPGNTIVRGFARSYARLLRLDAAALLALLDAITPNAPGEVRPPENMGNASEPKGLRQMSLLMAAAVVISLAAALLALWHFLKPEQVKSMPPGEAARLQGPVADTPAAPAALPAQPAAASEVKAQSEIAANPDPALLFIFSGKSWLEVTDAEKRVVHSGENPPDSKLTLTGKPPFDIVIGNAGKVKLSYGEREIDLAPYTRAEVARLKVE